MRRHPDPRRPRRTPTGSRGSTGPPGRATGRRPPPRSEWSLPQLLGDLHKDVERRLQIVRDTLGHPTVKGDGSARVWLELFENYLPRRYCAETAHVVDSKGSFSDQIDVAIYDRQYSPLIFHYAGQKVLPAESVYAVFEVKQAISAGLINYAQKKVASVRRLHRTSLAIPHAGGTFEPKEPANVLGGILAFDSGWNPPLGDPLVAALGKNSAGRLDLSCAALHGTFSCDGDRITLMPTAKAATAFLLELIARLQELGTVPMLDTRAYARWLTR
jgi:hypothetical protein